MKLLIAEDDLTSRAMLSALLQKWGFETVAVEDGQAAWDLLQQPAAPKLVILDWNMPELDGLEVCRRVKALETDDPPYIIILTSRDEKGSIVTGLEAGANDYITKPYDNDELRARIDVGKRMVLLQAALADRMRELKKALESIRTLKNFIPICASCKKIRNDQGYWDGIEEYIESQTDSQFSHGICPDCMKKLYPELCEEEEKECAGKT